MSKPVKALIRDELTRRLDGVTSLAVVGLTGVDAITATDIRKRLGEKEIRLLVVKNALARQAFKAGGLEVACDLLEGPCALAYGGDNVVSTVRELLDIKKEQAPNLVVKAAVMDGEAFASDRIEALSKFPTREEAIAKVLSCALAPGMKAAACIIAPGSKIASLLKTIEENHEDETAEEAPAEEAPAEEAPAEEAPAEEAPAEEASAEEAPAEEAPAEEAAAEEAPAEEAAAEEAPAEEAPAEEAAAEEAPADEEKPE
jgi:ribosomal protein L10